MNSIEIRDTLMSALGLHREPVGIRAWKEIPGDVPRYQGSAFPGMCTQISEVLASGRTFYVTGDHCYCTGGVVATGVVPPTQPEDREEIIKAHFAISKGYKDIPTALCYEDQMERLIPRVPTAYAAAQLGLLRDMEQADVVLIFCTPSAADMVSRTYCYSAGEPIAGFAGNGGCPFLIQYPFVTGKPSFSCSDVAWRKNIGLAPEELTLGFPYNVLSRVCSDLPEVVSAYRRYGEVMDEG